MKISWRNSDFIEIDLKAGKVNLEVNGCQPLHDLANKINGISESEIDAYIAKLGLEHQELLMKEALLRLQGKWKFPYTEEELCHCRMIPTKVVDEAVIGGLRTPEEIGRFCSAGITCGNCGTDIAAIISCRT